MFEKLVGIEKALKFMSRQPKTCIGYEQLTVIGGAAQTLTPTSGATYCEIRVETAVSGSAIRYRMDGTAPTTTVGMHLVNGDMFDIDGPTNISALKVIAVSGSNVLNIQYYK